MKAEQKGQRKQAQRDEQRRAEVRRERAVRRQRAVKASLAVLALIAVVVAVAVSVGLQGRGPAITTAVAASLGSPTGAPPSGTGHFHPAGPILRQNGMPEVLFIGAQYCPFCAAERWALVKALGQFGTWSHLTSTSNTQGESGFGLIPTFDLLHAKYRSTYVTLDSKDTEDRHFNQLQALTAHENALFNRYDNSGGIPLVAVGGYSMIGSGYSPGAIDGQSFSSVQRALQGNRSLTYVNDINAEANMISALVCHADGNRPATACNRSVIHEIERRIR